VPSNESYVTWVLKRGGAQTEPAAVPTQTEADICDPVDVEVEVEVEDNDSEDHSHHSGENYRDSDSDSDTYEEDYSSDDDSHSRSRSSSNAQSSSTAQASTTSGAKPTVCKKCQKSCRKHPAGTWSKSFSNSNLYSDHSYYYTIS
jgi:hypothetical protein